MWNKIYKIQTNKFDSIYSKKSQQILSNYLKIMNGGSRTNSIVRSINKKIKKSAKKPIKKGDVFTKDNLTTKRPFLEDNIPAMDFEKMIGKTSNFNYNIDDFIIK